MIIYEAQNKQTFLADQPFIEEKLKARISEAIQEDPSQNEVISWKNSIAAMADVIKHKSIPEDVGIFLEYNIPTTDNRVDFIITGLDDEDKETVILIELKQWKHVNKTDKDGIVETWYEEGMKETIHPSYQVFTYAYLLYSNMKPVQDQSVKLRLAAYLHNCVDKSIVRDCFYGKYLQHAEVFCKDDEQELIDFIVANIKKGDRGKGLYEIEQGEIRPSKALADSIAGMVEGNREFMMIDSQKVVYENILAMYAKYERTGKKQIMIVTGGPGTGKSVIGINLLCEATRRRWNAKYVTKNSAPRNVYSHKLTQNSIFRINSCPVNSLFKSSMSYCFSVANQYDLIIVDEAHRLMNGTRDNPGDDQMLKLINAAKTIVFFIDENQRVSLEDFGTISGIRERAEKLDCDNPIMDELTSQFRCNGSTDYLKWLDNILQITPRKIAPLHEIGYDFDVLDTPNEVMDFIREKNSINNKSRVVAGYCWTWVSSKKGYESTMDISYPEYGFAYQWNKHDDNIWSISEGSIDQIGCVHTCQGLEFDYVGVIVADDVIYRDGRIQVVPSRHPSDDKNLSGWKKIVENQGEEGKECIRRLIKNTYRTLMTRGMKGCRVYIHDEALRDYVRSYL